MNNCRYIILESRSGDKVPAFFLQSGETKPLHSMIDPEKEASRLVSSIKENLGFAVFLGLGGGFAPQKALEETDAKVLVIDFNIKELVSLINYKSLFSNERFTLLEDPSCEEIIKIITEQYNPHLCGNLKIIPLRTRTDLNPPLFETAATAVKEAVEIVSKDYSVQAHFGKRWFSNIIRNVKTAGSNKEIKINFSFSVKKTAIAAAGPSLDQQIQSLSEHGKNGFCIICTDTALPVLLHNGIKPDIVMSIDCQHISLNHFFGCNLNGINMIFDIASPPMLPRLASSPYFIASGHPLAQYLTAAWQPLPVLDISGGNVTYACLSLADYLGAENITLFGADFSYIKSRTYAKGTYIYPFFENRQNRFSPLEALSSAFLYRSPFLPAEDGSKNKNYYETSSLKFYRKKLEEKASIMNAQITIAHGQGAKIVLTKKFKTAEKSKNSFFQITKEKNISGIDFLEQYRKDIASLPEYSLNYINKLNNKEKQIFTTLLPGISALKHRNQQLKTQELIEKIKHHCIDEIEKVLN